MNDSLTPAARQFRFRGVNQRTMQLIHANLLALLDTRPVYYRRQSIDKDSLVPMNNSLTIIKLNQQTDPFHEHDEWCKVEYQRVRIKMHSQQEISVTAN
jgi:hypothetical protein